MLASLVWFFTIVAVVRAKYPCSSDIYCYGKILHTVQMSSIFRDSKTFVDMKIKESTDQVKANFEILMSDTKNKPNNDQIMQFILKNFDPPGSEFMDWNPSDWKKDPKFLNMINDEGFRQWGSALNAVWKNLGRRIKDDVKNNPSLYSIIYLPHPFIVPGGRFREVYYWDSFWVIRGLLESEMYSTARGMLLNFASLVDKIGHIPNGGRIYYEMRSQPPLFIPMVDSYLQATNDFTLLEEIIDSLENEFAFWMNNRTVQVEKDGKTYTMATYNDFSVGPRPESYREDSLLVEHLTDEKEKNSLFSQLKAAAESGWDFSTRWFIKGKKKGKATLIDTKIKSIIPVDLNSIIYWNAVLLSNYFEKLQNEEKQNKYKEIANNWMKAVTDVLWHEEVGVWLDYDIANGVKRDNFYPSNVAPLWTNCYDQSKKEHYSQYVVNYLKKQTAVLDSAAGIPTTLHHSGEQWDYPNAWPPLQYIVIMALDQSNEEGREIAFGLTEKWLRSNFVSYNQSRAMFEKYDATVVGGSGGGGEYEVQLGFGWTNGIIMEFLHKYAHRLTFSDRFAKGSANPMYSANINPIVTLVLLQTSLIAGCVGAIIYAKKALPRPLRSLYTRIPD